MATSVQLQRVNAQIDEMLRLHRPDRYTTNDEDDAAWLDEVAEDVEGLIPEAEVRSRFARTLVRQREGQATRWANQELRKIWSSLDGDGQLPMEFWVKNVSAPIAIVQKVIFPGKKPEVLRQRVALRAATPEDLRMFAAEERRRAAQDFAAREAACSGAEWVADEMEQAGLSSFLEWSEGLAQS